MYIYYLCVSLIFQLWCISFVYCEKIVYIGELDEDVGFQFVFSEWWVEYVKLEDEEKIEFGGKLVLLFEIFRMSEEIGDKV